MDSHKVTWTVPFCFIASIILSIVKFFASSKTVSSSRCRMFVRSLQSSKTTISGCTVWMTVATSTWNKIIQKIIYVNAKLNWGITTNLSDTKFWIVTCDSWEKCAVPTTYTRPPFFVLRRVQVSGKFCTSSNLRFFDGSVRLLDDCKSSK